MALLPNYPTKRHMMNDAVETLFDKTPSQMVGKPISRVEGALKVSGQAPYAAEFDLTKELPDLPNQAYGVLVTATIAKGQVQSMDEDALVSIPGFIQVVSDPKHFIRNPQQGGKMKAPTQGVHEVAYHGQPIALVVAETFEAAIEAANALKVTYKDDSKNAVLSREDNLDKTHDISSGLDKNSEQGDPDRALSSSAFAVDNVYTTPGQNSAAMEPHATLAHWEDDKLVLHTSNQMLAFGKKQVADALDMDADNVQLIGKYIGGGFGSKLGIAPESIAAAIASQQLNRPVLVVMTRPQVMAATVRRSDTRQRVALGCDEVGNLNSIIHETVSTNLPEEQFFEPTALSTHYLYAGENRRVHYEKLDANLTLSGSMRAPGEAVGLIALECAVDEMAEKVGLDPIEFRRRNEPKKDPEQDIPFSSRKLVACMERGADEFGWKKCHHAEPASQLEGDWWIGTGMSASARGNQLKPSEARATLQLDDSKRLGIKAVIETDMTDIGTGSYTVFSQVAAELLGLPIDHIEMKLGDSDLPPAAGSGGSFGAASSGSSIYLACVKLREILAAATGLHTDTICLDDGKIRQEGEHDPSKVEQATDEMLSAMEETGSSIKDSLLEVLPDVASNAVVSTWDNVKNAKDAGLAQMGIGNGKLPTGKDYDFGDDKSHALKDVVASFDDQAITGVGKIMPGKNNKSYRQSSYGANFAEVAVHRVTGEIRVRRMTGVFEAGRILNRKTATSQCYGGMIFGIGSALMEQLIVDKHDGRLCNHNLAEYHVPVNADVPQLDVILLEEDDRYTNPMHIKGIGETAISGAAAAVANAIYNAVGVRVYDFPITLDKLLPDLPSAHQVNRDPAGELATKPATLSALSEG